MGGWGLKASVRSSDGEESEDDVTRDNVKARQRNPTDPGHLGLQLDDPERLLKLPKSLEDASSFCYHTTTKFRLTSYRTCCL